MASEEDGSPGNRPASRQEIHKLPRQRCTQCGMTGVSAMVRDGQCVNVLACTRRQQRDEVTHAKP